MKRLVSTFALAVALLALVTLPAAATTPEAEPPEAAPAVTDSPAMTPDVQVAPEDDLLFLQGKVIPPAECTSCAPCTADWQCGQAPNHGYCFDQFTAGCGLGSATVCYCV